ncbi:MAG: PSD1 and planctomycete cytochrome C domain-containing protein [Pirellulales bacterium]
MKHAFGLALAIATFAGGTVPADDTVDYQKQIKPLLRERCYACHGALKQQSGLRLDTAALIRQGGDGGPAAMPGQADQSLILSRVAAVDESRMPPEGEGAALSPEELSLLKAWINAGADGPADEQPEEDPAKHWAFQPIVRPAVPPLAEEAAAGRNPIDAFIAQQQLARGLVAAQSAASHALLRRVHLDLTGLPPTRRQLHAFSADPSPQAYGRVVDELLASPQYGERWGRHWMDVWRYCDWYGNAGSGSWWNSGCEIWRWRDWIVRSLNQDKGYDRMILEMLAADEIAPEDDETIVATGFIVRNWYALNHNSWKRDMVEHTGKAFLGLTFNCCHCHDHKYDPISQREYFQFRAFFEPLELRQDRVAGTPDPGAFRPYSVDGPEHMPVSGGMIRVVDAHPDALTFIYRGGDERDVVEDAAPVQAAPPAFLNGAAVQAVPVELPLPAWYPGVKPFIAQEEIAQAEQALKTALANSAASPHSDTLAAAANLARARLDSVLARQAADGARYLGQPGDAAELARAASRGERLVKVAELNVKLAEARQALSAAIADVDKAEEGAALKQLDVLAAQTALADGVAAVANESEDYTPFSPSYVKTSTGRRTALAQWIVARDNPLTARVAANHIWLRHFGRPLVATVNNFGRNGQKPSHPALLDWLAAELIESGWSMKHLHRLIVTSDAYRRSSEEGRSAEANLAIDPEAQFLWRFPPRRLEAEAIRDSVLFAAGQLDLTLGGPDIPTKDEPQSRRRSLYFNIRPTGFPSVKLLEMFDPASPTDCYRRAESLLPQQALAMANSPLSIGQSRLLAQRLEQDLEIPGSLSLGERADERDAADDVNQVLTQAAFETILSRPPTAEELASCQEFLATQLSLYQSRDLGQSAGKTPEGTPPPAANPAARARESLVRVLLNHHDFVTMP